MPSTGMKCLPQSKISLANGNVLHDWHAEVLAIRAFNRFLIDECALLAKTGQPSSEYIRRREEGDINASEFQPFTIKEDVQIHMYCSEAPCGDASMELTMSLQEDATPWPIENAQATNTEDIGYDAKNVQLLRGRGYFSELGIVRRKPSRPDAPPTLSKSCTDKIALAQCTSLLLSPTSLLVSPGNAYLHTLVLPSSQFVPEACARAFSPSGRFATLIGAATSTWPSPYAYRPFKTTSTSPSYPEFRYSRRACGGKLVPCNLSAVYTPHFQETLIGGVLAGRKQFDARGASALCRRSVWRAVGAAVAEVAIPALVAAVRKTKYEGLKAERLLVGRDIVKRDVRGCVLKGWVRNVGDESWSGDAMGVDVVVGGV